MKERLEIAGWKIAVPLFLCAAAMALSACNTGLTRTGYKFTPAEIAQNTNLCPMAIRCNAKYDTNDVEVLGSIHAYDAGLSTYCDEAYILEIFCKDACALGADVINITEEHQPDMVSSCYRARAQFLRFKDRTKASGLVSDAKYSPELIIERSVRSKVRAREVISTTLFSGPLAGLIVASATNPHSEMTNSIEPPPPPDK